MEMFFKDKHSSSSTSAGHRDKTPMGQNPHGTKPPWDKTPMGLNPHGTKPTWDKNLRRQNPHGTKPPGD